MNNIWQKIKSGFKSFFASLGSGVSSVAHSVWRWILSLFQEEYELVVWFHSETIGGSDGLKSVARSRKGFTLTALTKKTPTHIVGKDEHGHPFEIKTVEPFDYTIRKTK